MPVTPYSKGVSSHARDQILAKGAPFVYAKTLIRAIRRKEARIVSARGNRVGVEYLNYPFVYILNHTDEKDKDRPTIITVLTKEEYENIMIG